MVPYPQSQLQIDQLVTKLAKFQDARIFLAPNFTMLIWPAGAAAWQFLEQRLPNVPDEVTLRFLVREPLPLFQYQKQILSTIDHGNEFEDELEKSYDTMMMAFNAAQPINDTFSTLFNIRYQYLTAANDPGSGSVSGSFFLCFQPIFEALKCFDDDNRSQVLERASMQHDIFVRFLQANKAKEIFSCHAIGSTQMMSNGAWDCFRHSVQSGCIVVSILLCTIEKLSGFGF